MKGFHPVEMPTGEQDETLNIVSARGPIPAVAIPCHDDYKNPIHIGTKEAMFHPDAISIKYFFYLLAGWKKDRFEHMQQIYPLFDTKVPNLEKRLKEILKIFFKKVVDRIMALARSRRIRIEHVALTIPPTWEEDPKLYDLYRDIIVPLFPEVAPNNFHFVDEAQACNALIHNKDLTFLDENDWHLFVEPGGHTTVI
jgi:hypothetical protein